MNVTAETLPAETALSPNAYHFITRWYAEATPEEVYRILEDVEALAIWWPSVYLDIKVVEKGQKGGVGKLVELYTKGWLPYTLRWKFRVTHTDFPKGFALEAIGDFVGRGIWTFTPQGTGTAITYDWKIEAEKPLLKRLSGLMKPLFSMNHEWAMAKGLESLTLELRRRKGEANVPKATKPTFPHNLTHNKIL
ncbi:MAG: SRPBCC family protein [Spirosomataceae bacterium]